MLDTTRSIPPPDWGVTEVVTHEAKQELNHWSQQTHTNTQVSLRSYIEGNAIMEKMSVNPTVGIDGHYVVHAQMPHESPTHVLTETQQAEVVTRALKTIKLLCESKFTCILVFDGQPIVQQCLQLSFVT